ncbi:MAG: DUF6351 family protein [Acidobacteriia bacterium]|nr:DUF6351 family protein [Terriglobia bacterium]
MPLSHRAVLSAAALLTLFVSATPAALAAVELRALSGRPDMLTGGEALIETNAPQEKFSATLNGQDVTRSFRPGKTRGSLLAHIDGLKLGKNTLEIKSSKGSAKLELTNYPITGPVFSGPHQKPFVCQTEQAGLGAPLDEDCSVKAVVTYVYKSTEAPPPGAGRGAGRGGRGPGALPTGFKPFDPSAPRPADLAKTTTSDGKTVDYIVRRERGTINRAIYEITMLHDPAEAAPDPWTASTGWNGRLVYSFGGGCAAGYRQGLPGGALTDDFLSKGYAIAASSLNVFGNNCDDVISSETMMMVKEHFIGEFGVPVHTIGTGGSGGAIQQYMMAQNYPGLLDGLMPQISFPDNAIFESVIDCSLLDHAFNSTKTSWNDDQKALVSGYATWKTCSEGWMARGSATSLANNQVKAAACNPAIPKALAFDPATNPAGARCDYFDDMVNVYGKDHKTGAARRPLDNVGVQYGLAAFNAKQISFEQFVDLNEVIGGHDVDGNIVSARDVADPVGLKLAYQTGRVNTGGGSLGIVPILDTRGYFDMSGNLHDRFRSMVTRARLKEANGSSDNQATLMFPPSGPAPQRPGELLELMNQWLDHIGADTSSSTTAAKVAHDKPADLADACWTEQGEKITEPLTYDGKGRCNQLYPAHADARIVAGSPLTDEVLKCELKPVTAKDYTQPLTPDQMARLKAAFPQGVCDYTRPGVSQQRVEGAWRRY